LKRDCFRLESLMTRDYIRIANRYKSQYRKRYEIIKHFYPDISAWRYKLKWQYPRRMMDYDFQPRDKNKIIAKKFIRKHNIFVDNIGVDYIEHPDAINSMDFFAKVTNQTNDYDSTSLGCMIEGLKICRMVVGNLKSHLSHLALLMGKPLICIDNQMPIDNINLMNPLNTKIIFAENIDGGLESYDNSI